MSFESPEEILRLLWHRVEGVKPPVAEPPGWEWFAAAGALLAFGRTGVLDEEQISRWEAVGQKEAQRLNPDNKPIPRPPAGVRPTPDGTEAERSP